MIEFTSIVILAFALASVILGAITVWLETQRRQILGIALIVIGLVTGTVYLFLGSRFSVALFGHLIVRVDLPVLMTTAFTYTAGVLVGVALAAGLFLWATGRFPQEVTRSVILITLAGLSFAALAIAVAALLGVF